MFEYFRLSLKPAALAVQVQMTLVAPSSWKIVHMCRQAAMNFSASLTGMPSDCDRPNAPWPYISPKFTAFAARRCSAVRDPVAVAHSELILAGNGNTAVVQADLRDLDAIFNADPARKLLDFEVEGRIVQVSPGPIITSYEFEPAPGIKISRVVNLADDLALALKAAAVRIVGPIPGRGTVAIEVPNSEQAMVYLREIFASPEFADGKRRLPLALGKDVTGTPVACAARMMPSAAAAATVLAPLAMMARAARTLARAHALRPGLRERDAADLAVAQLLEHLRTELATRKRQIVGHVAHGDATCASDVRVRGFFAQRHLRFDDIPTEHLEVNALALRLACRFQRGDGRTEQRTRPFPIEARLGARMVAGIGDERELLFGGIEIEAHLKRAAAAFTIEHLGASEWLDVPGKGYVHTGQNEFMNFAVTAGPLKQLVIDGFKKHDLPRHVIQKAPGTTTGDWFHKSGVPHMGCICGPSYLLKVTPGGEIQREYAIRLAVNIAMYVLCSNYKDDQVHAPFLMRRRRAELP